MDPPKPPIDIRGARENNLKNIDVKIPTHGLTVVTGVSGSGKSSLVFDTVFHESKRRFYDIFSLGSSTRIRAANVETISGLGPAIAVDQNVLNRNPHSTLATASGLHPFFRLLYARFGERRCPHCGEPVLVMTEDEILERILLLNEMSPLSLHVPLVHGVRGSHGTLLRLLSSTFGSQALTVDGHEYSLHAAPLDPRKPHDISLNLGDLPEGTSSHHIRSLIQQGFALGSYSIGISSPHRDMTLSRASVCTQCGQWIKEIEPKHFHIPCDHCGGKGCTRCGNTGLNPEAAAVYWKGTRLPDLLALSVAQARDLFEGSHESLPSSAHRLLSEILNRLHALYRVGLGYITLDRSSPTLSRGEAQRVRLALAMISQLEDMVHILDEPTIGQHPADVERLFPAFRSLPGPVIIVEHDRYAAAGADHIIDLGPDAGSGGGRIVFTGTPQQLWETDTPTGLYFSLKKKVWVPAKRPAPHRFMTVRGAHLRNLKAIDIPIPLNRLTVITGVSGSGKSTLLDVIIPSLHRKTPTGCEAIDGPFLNPVVVDQSPIGRNPRSNPATYTHLSDSIRELFAVHTGLSPSHFSFNRPEGQCPACKGMGAVEVSLRYLPSTWITCERCGGNRFSDEVVSQKVLLGGNAFSIADMYRLRIEEILPFFVKNTRLPERNRRKAIRILTALQEVGLGYLQLGQPSPTLSGGEAQRVKLAKYLGSPSLSDKLLILDEPSTGLHPRDISGLLTVLDGLVCRGCTVVVVEHNTDIIRAADWIIDLGPGAGPLGGEVLYAGIPEGIYQQELSETGKALKTEQDRLLPSFPCRKEIHGSQAISIRNACANNLKGVDVDIPKGSITVITGVSGSGKSSLVHDVLESEARRRFLESLSMYERQTITEGPEAPVDCISGLGVAVSIDESRKHFSQRSTIGKETEIMYHLTSLLAYLGERTCEKCGSLMKRESEEWTCPSCYGWERIAAPREFLPSNWLSACPTCQGVGTVSRPNPEKLILHPDKPLCGGAMYSPGYFPFGYMCKPSTMYYAVRALGKKYGFDPETTSWNDMSPEARHAFLYGDAEPLEIHLKDGKGRVKLVHQPYRGFYQLIGDWDQFGTYVDIVTCPECKGTTLRPEFLAVRLGGYTIHELGELPLTHLREVLHDISKEVLIFKAAQSSHSVILTRIGFLIEVGLGYLNLNRMTASLSAGEAERIKLAGVLGSHLTSLTILLDEPTRGLHPSEVTALMDALVALKQEGNTIIVVEHDPVVIAMADHLIDLGPGAGPAGGIIMAQGTPDEVARSSAITGQWLRGDRNPCIYPLQGAQRKLIAERRNPVKWMRIREPRAHNLKGEDVNIPLGVLVGLCGVSGSGKSTLLMDTVSRALSPKKHTTSVAYEPLTPGEHGGIEGSPGRVIAVDQTKQGIFSPVKFLHLKSPLTTLYAHSEDAQALGVDTSVLSTPCSVCNGSGVLTTDMGFLPDIHTPCETCKGTGYIPEAWDIKIRGYALPELLSLTIDEVLHLFKRDHRISRPLKAAQSVGLGYLVLQQPAYTLSGGEAQRLKIARELYKKGGKETLYILDEPTLGQHLEDVQRLITVLHGLVEEGHSVVVIEHHPHVLAACDWVIELGPGGGPHGGSIIATGPPESIARGNTPTAPYLREVLERYT
ncbi:MAG: ATP-binding cassette domain-containing protein [Theionarchaea archaeon]|nr:ATP-binding cassette domain-containing protein [Theionarchaea archaeon]